jgi:hypothetical protein
MHAIMASRESRGAAPLIFNLGIRWRHVVSLTLLLLYSWGKNPQYPLNRKLGGPQTWSGHFGEEKSLLPLLGIEPWIVQAHSLVIILTTLSRYHADTKNCFVELNCLNMSYKSKNSAPTNR